MEFVILDIETLKEVDAFWETRRKNNDGTKAIIHREIWDELINYATPLPTEGEDTEVDPYPYPTATGDEINAMPEFQYPIEETLMNDTVEQSTKEEKPAPQPVPATQKAKAKKK